MIEPTSCPYSLHSSRGVINGKAGKAAALPKFSDTLTLSQSEGADYTQPLALPHLIVFRGYAPVRHYNLNTVMFRFGASLIFLV